MTLRPKNRGRVGPSKQSERSFADAMRAMLNDPDWNPVDAEDRAIVKAWVASDDASKPMPRDRQRPVTKIKLNLSDEGPDTEEQVLLPPSQKSLERNLISDMLRARRMAQDGKASLEKARKVRERILEVAKKLEDAARLYGQLSRDSDPRWAAQLEYCLRLPLEELKKSREQEAKLLRQLSASEPRSPFGRQTRGEKRSDVCNIFATMMVDGMRRATGKPQYKIVATCTNIAFPDAKMNAKAVEATWRYNRDKVAQIDDTTLDILLGPANFIRFRETG